MLRRNALKVWRHQQAHGLLVRTATVAQTLASHSMSALTGGDLGALARQTETTDRAIVSLAVKLLKAEAQRSCS